MKDLSIIIPVRNRAGMLRRLLKGLYARGSLPEGWEVIVVDDCSEEPLEAVAKEIGCRYLRLSEKVGAPRARNLGVGIAEGEVLFFTDSDCVVEVSTVLEGLKKIRALGKGHILGGTYKPLSFDRRFFSEFQSLFIHYSETRCAPKADYIATHAMWIYREDFLSLGGFREGWPYLIEDVDFSHRARAKGFVLVMDPHLQVGHYFGFGLYGFLRNAFRKTFYWSIYLIESRGFFSDSGTASRQLKATVAGFYISIFLCIFLGLKGIFISSFLLMVNGFLSSGLIKTFRRYKGPGWAFFAGLYYLILYPIPIGFGGIMGLIGYLFKRSIKE